MIHDAVVATRELKPTHEDSAGSNVRRDAIEDGPLRPVLHEDHDVARHNRHVEKPFRHRVRTRNKQSGEI